MIQASTTKGGTKMETTDPELVGHRMVINHSNRGIKCEMIGTITHIDSTYPRTAYGATFSGADNPGMVIQGASYEPPGTYHKVRRKCTIIHCKQIVRAA